MIGAARLSNISGPNVITPTANVVGDAVGTSADVAKFGSRSYKAWNGTGNSTTYIQMSPSAPSSWVPAYAPFNYAKGFTAEWWIYMTAAPTTTVNIWQRALYSTEWRFLMQANRIAQFRYRYYNPYPGTITERVISSNVVTALNTWTHLAFTTQDGTIRFFQDGSLIASFTETQGIIESGDSNTGYIIGEGAASSMRYYIDELRVSDVCRYSASFTPQQSTFSYDNNTVALLKFEETAGSKNFNTNFDPQVRPPTIISAVGNAQISTAQSKFGGASLLLDGTGDFIVGENRNSYDVGTGDFTIEGWIYRLGTTGSFPRFFCYRGVSTRAVEISIEGGSVYCWIGTSSALFLGNFGTTTGVWNHIAIVRSSGVVKCYKDGVALNSGVSNSSSLSYTSNYLVGIGAQITSATDATANTYFYGYFDEIRWSKVARYTANFTVPTQPFVNDDNTLLLIHADGTNGSTTFTDANR